MMGYSWEGFVLEHISQLAPRGAEVMFYRTAAGAEMDVVVQHGGQTIGFEFKSSSAPKVKQGFHNAMQDLKPTATFIVAQGGQTLRVFRSGGGDCACGYCGCVPSLGSGFNCRCVGNL